MKQPANFENEDVYYLSIRDDTTGVLEEMLLNEEEFRVLHLAINHNYGIVNMLGNKELIHGLFRKGLVTFSEKNQLKVSKLEDLVITNELSNAVFNKIYDINKISLERIEDAENRPNSFFMSLSGKSICFCLL